MARISVSFSNQNVPLAYVREKYQVSMDALNDFYRTTNSRFISYTMQEFQQELDKSRDELEKVFSLDLLSCVEASCRIDYLNRLGKKLKDPVSQAMRALKLSDPRKASLEDHILSIWQNTGSYRNSYMSEIKRAFKYRHWLAHGRYWVLRNGITFDFPSLYALMNPFISYIQSH